jgi:hypothetical protein
MIHIRVDEEDTNDKRRFLCGIGPKLPPGDIYYFPSEARRAGLRSEDVCPGCYPDGKPEFGTPISRLSGRPGHPGWEEFKRIAASWGYD